MAERYELVGTMTWEQAKAVAEALGGGSCVWDWHNGKKSCYPVGSIEIHSVAKAQSDNSGEAKS